MGWRHGTALASSRPGWGHHQGFYEVPFSAYLYVGRCLQQTKADFAYHDFQAFAHRMRVHLHCIVGLPDESPGSVRNTIRFLRRVRPDSAQFPFFEPYPGTQLYQDLRESGELGNLDALDWDAACPSGLPLLPTRHMSLDDLRRARHRMSVNWQFSLGDRVRTKLRRVPGVGRQTP